jgi:CO dehydrogenase/acetyl-CoA synthase alpha subunit
MLIDGKVDPTKILEDAEKAFTDLQALSNCTNVQDFIDAAVEEYISRVNATNAKACQTDVDGIYTDVEAVIADVKNGDETKLLLDLTKLASAAESMVADCKPVGLKFNPNADACSNDAEDAIDTFFAIA